MDNKNHRNIIGLQIGGTVGPNDSVGMHVAMPEKPGIGVSVDINSGLLDDAVREVGYGWRRGHANSNWYSQDNETVRVLA